MTRGGGRAPAAARAGGSPWPGPRLERVLVAALLVVHAVLAGWIATRNSVTFDENFHVPAGVVALARGDFSTSLAQPPLARSFYGAAALLAGARLPDPAVEVPTHERELGESFMRRNADRYLRVFLAARGVAVLLSIVLAAWVWAEARRRYGPLAGLVALAAWALSPEALAHGSLAGVDLPTALAVFGVVLAVADWCERGRWVDWARAAAWLAVAFLVRFSAVQLLGVTALLLVVGVARRRLGVGRAVGGLFALGAVAWLAVLVGYRFQGVGTPLGAIEFHSSPFLALAGKLRFLPSPLPVPYLRGLDYLAFLAQPGGKVGYFLGAVTQQPDWRYFLVAIGVKWPLGVLVLVALRALFSLGFARERAAADLPLVLTATVVIGSAMAANLGYGVRYVLPALPLLCVWIAGLARGDAGAGRPSPAAMLVLAVALAVPLEAARSLPYPLAFFNGFAAAPGAGERIVNDSNVDWGQGLVALREDMARLGIRRVHLAYHGTVDPALYGIESMPFLGGMPGPEADYLAVSSYFYVGLPAWVMTAKGYTPEPVTYDLRPLWNLAPVAHPAGCMWIFRIR